mgnify:CR=1 FL=1
MKKILLVFAGTLFLSSIHAQKITSDNVPLAVTTAFKSKFSIAEKTTWEMDYENFQADFTVGKSEFSSKFDKEGKWLETETYLKASELPKIVKDALSKKYGELSAYKIESPMKVEKEKATTYAMDIIKGENTYELVFDEAGELLEDDVKTSNKKD